MFVGISYVISLVIGFLVAYLSPGTHTTPIIAETILRSVLLLAVGIPLLVSGLGHVFQSDLAARRLGWPTGNPFQKELGFWDIAGGVGTLIAFWRGGDFRLATIIINVVFWICAGILHIQHVIQHKNYNADNLIPAAVDVLVPVTLIVLLLLAH